MSPVSFSDTLTTAEAETARKEDDRPRTKDSGVAATQDGGRCGR